MAVTKLSQIVKLNGSFRNSINLYLNLNKKEKIDSYIPTKSSLNILKRYVGSVIKNKDHSTILIGSYGKGKSHLLLILLAIVSMQRTKENNEIVKSLLKKIRMVDEETFEIVSSVWNKKGRFLPVIISGSIDDVSRSFMIALNDALKRENLMNLMLNYIVHWHLHRLLLATIHRNLLKYLQDFEVYWMAIMKLSGIQEY